MGITRIEPYNVQQKLAAEAVMYAGLHLVSNLDVLPGRLRMPEPMLEMDRTENPLRDLLTQPRFQASAGMVAVPDQPGLGVEIDLALLKEFSKK